MRRTPSFTAKATHFRRLVRPSPIVGDYLENRRILKALNSYFHYPELEGVTEDEEALDALYLFDGSRFLNKKVTEPFVDEDLGFSHMLKMLCETALHEIGYGWSVDHYNPQRFTELLTELKQGKYPTFNLLLDISSFLNSQFILTEDQNYDGLIAYASDYNHSHSVFRKIEEVYLKCTLFLNSWNNYDAIAKSEDSFAGRFNAFIYRLERETNSKAVRDFRSQIFSFRIFSSYKWSDLDNYIKRLSACMNLPSDKDASPGERDLIEKWFVLFNAFAPQYQKLRSWYEQSLSK